jgi:hypothetical protein
MVTNFTETHPLGAERMYADRRTDMTREIGAFA